MIRFLILILGSIGLYWYYLRCVIKKKYGEETWIDSWNLIVIVCWVWFLIILSR